VTRPEPEPAPAVPSTKTADTVPAQVLTGTEQRPLVRPPAERKPPPPVPSSTVTLSPEEQTPGSFETRTRVSPSPADLRPKDRQAAMTEPLPKVDSILIDQDRRLALIDGAIVGVGEAVGSRVVVQIDRNAVVLREPSGRIVRVRLRAPMGG